MSNIVLKGDLGFLALGDVLQLIGSNGATGTLHVRSKYTTDPGMVYFSKGNIINAVAGSEKGLKAAYALFGWIDGEFEFVEEEIDVPKVINETRMAIILDGCRMVDDGQVKKLGPVSFEDQLADASDQTTSYRQIHYPVIKGPLVDYMYVVSEDEFSEGQTIIEESKHGSWNWTVLEGMVDIIKETKRGPIKIYRIGDGAFLGSIDALSFTGSARNATAVAATGVQLGVLDAQRLTAEYASLSPEFKGFIKSLERRLREVTDKTVAIYLNKNNYKSLLKDSKLVVRQSSSELGQFFTITDGEAYVVQHTDFGPLLLAQLGVGDFVGKLPFLDIGHEPISASVFGSPGFKVTRPEVGRLRDEYNQLSSTLKNMIENVATSIMVTSRVAWDFKKRSASEGSKK